MDYPVTKLTHFFTADNSDKPSAVLDFENKTNQTTIRFSLGLLYIKNTNNYYISVEIKSKLETLFNQTVEYTTDIDTIPKGNIIDENLFGATLDYTTAVITFKSSGPVRVKATLYDNHGFEIDTLYTELFLKNVKTHQKVFNG